MVGPVGAADSPRTRVRSMDPRCCFDPPLFGAPFAGRWCRGGSCVVGLGAVRIDFVRSVRFVEESWDGIYGLVLSA